MAHYISIEEFSSQHGIEVTLIREFAEFGLLQTHVQHNLEYLMADDLTHVRRLVRLYQDLGINKEGIDIILSMREQILSLQQELETLRYKAQRLEQERHQRLLDFPSIQGLIIDLDED
jgi:DNA-binding transcriptional MerR regulator